MRGALLLLLVFSACYNPKLGNPGYYCHPEDNPACPDGQTCVDGRCIDDDGPHIVGGGQDAGVGSGGSDGGNTGGGKDAGTGGGKDASTGGSKPDMTTGGTTTLDCQGYVDCLVACGTDTTCGDGCATNATSSAQTKFQDATQCAADQCYLDYYCDDLDGDGYYDDTTDCNTCINNGVAPLLGGSCTSDECQACQTEVNACAND